MVLVAYVPASYGLLLGRNFCRDVGGELSMNMTEAHIPVKGEVKKLYLEKESKFTVVKSDDQRAQILFESSGMGNYFLHANDEVEIVPEIEGVFSHKKFSSDCESTITKSVGSSSSQEETLTFDTSNMGDPNDVWTPEFDGSHSSTESRADIVLVSPEGNFFPFSFKL